MSEPAPTLRKPELLCASGYLVGLAFDDDKHRRVTTGHDFVAVGGSEATHARMQSDLLRIGDELQRRGLTVADLNGVRDLVEIARAAASA